MLAEAHSRQALALAEKLGMRPLMAHCPRIETGAYEIDADELVASDRLLARHPDAQVWLRLVGSPYTRRFGACSRRDVA